MAVSYRDPLYDRLEIDMSAKFGLPANLMASIRLIGEKSNSNQVSPVGASSVYQIMPKERAVMLKRHGVDAYESPQSAAWVSGKMLQESLQRNGGDTMKAVREHIGGVKPQNWGPVTNAYTARVMGAINDPSVLDIARQGGRGGRGGGGGAPSSFAQQVAASQAEQQAQQSTPATRTIQQNIDFARSRGQSDAQIFQQIVKKDPKYKQATGGGLTDLDIQKGLGLWVEPPKAAVVPPKEIDYTGNQLGRFLDRSGAALGEVERTIIGDGVIDFITSAPRAVLGTAQALMTGAGGMAVEAVAGLSGLGAGAQAALSGGSFAETADNQIQYARNMLQPFIPSAVVAPKTTGAVLNALAIPTFATEGAGQANFDAFGNPLAAAMIQGLADAGGAAVGFRGVGRAAPPAPRPTPAQAGMGSAAILDAIQQRPQPLAATPDGLAAQAGAMPAPATPTAAARTQLTPESPTVTITPDGTPAPAAPVAQSGVILRANGTPFDSAGIAEGTIYSRNMQDTHAVVEVDGGWGIAPKVGDTAAPVSTADTIKPTTDAVQREDGKSFVVDERGAEVLHGSGNAALTLDNIQIVRTNADGSKQNTRKGTTYGGLYAADIAKASDADNYAGMVEGSEPTVYSVRIAPGTKVLELNNTEGGITRLKDTYIDELVAQGYGVVRGTDTRGRTEYAIIDKNAIESMQPRVKAETKPAAPAAPAPVARTTQGTARTTDNTPISFTYDVVPVESLTKSVNADMTPNTAARPELQPRNRDSAASTDQINNIANNLDPAQLLESPTFSTGAPVVLNGEVVAGHGRTTAIERRYGSGRGAEYKAAVLAKARELGIDPALLEGIENPVLVRRVADEATAVKVATDSNVDTTLRMNPTEQAKVDAQSLPDTSKLLMNADGSVNIAGSGDFVRAFMQSLSRAARGDMTLPDGTLSQNGLRRIQAAITQKAYNDATLLDRLSSSLDDQGKRISDALSKNAGALVTLADDVKAGSVVENTLAADLAQAANKYADLRASGITVSEYMSQGKLVDDGMTAGALEALQVFGENARSGKAVSEYIQSKIAEIREKGDPNQDTLFQGKNKVNASEIAKSIESNHEGLTLRLSGGNNGRPIVVSLIRVDQANRGQGTARKAMLELIDVADALGLKLALDPSADFGASRARLTSFYKRLGFIENKGRAKDFEISESMYRPEKKGEDTLFQGKNKSASQVIADEIARQVEETGKFSPEYAKAVGALAAAYYKATAAAIGKTSKEVFALIGLDVKAGAVPDGTKAKITFGKDQHAMVLGEDANASSFVHELGHHMLETHAKLAPDNPIMQADLDAVMEWGGQKGRKYGDLSAAQKTELHEKFAETFEAYLLEGKAPTAALKGVFERFKDWMTSVYESLLDFSDANPRAKLSPDIVGILDSMLGNKSDARANAGREATRAKQERQDGTAELLDYKRSAPVDGGVAPALHQLRYELLREIGLTEGQIRGGSVTGDSRRMGWDTTLSKSDTKAGQKMKQQLDLETDKLREYGDAAVEATGGMLRAEPETRGALILKPLEAYQKWYREKIKAFYAAADAKASNTGGIQLTDFQAKLRENSFFDRAVIGDIRKGIASWLSKNEQDLLNADGSIKPMSAKQAESLRKFINTFYTYETAYSIGILNGLIDDAVFKELGTSMYADARKVNATYHSIFTNADGMAALLESDGINRKVSNERIASKMVTLAETDIAQFRHIISQLENMPTPELQKLADQAIGEIRAQIAEKLTAFDPTKPDTLGGIGKAYAPFRGKKLDEIFGKETADMLRNFVAAHGVLRKVDPNPSGTATTMQNLKMRAAEVGGTGLGAAAGGAMGGMVGSAVGGVVGQQIGTKIKNRIIENIDRDAYDKAMSPKQLEAMRQSLGARADRLGETQPVQDTMAAAAEGGLTGVRAKVLNARILKLKEWRDVYSRLSDADKTSIKKVGAAVWLVSLGADEEND